MSLKTKGTARPHASLQPGASSKTPITCPICGKPNADFRRKRNGDYNVACWSCQAAGLTGGDYLRAVAEKVGAPGGSALISDAPPWLGHLATGPPGGARHRPLPTPAQVKGWASRLGSSRAPLTWLRRERGLALEVVRRARIGWDGDNERLVFPMYAGGELVAAKSRRLEAGAQMRAWAGRGRAWPLYPEPPEGGPVLLVAGELDALRGRTAGLPASSVTLGAGKWRDEWTAELRDRRVVVCFDVGEQEAARQRVAELRASGIRARRLDLRKLGLGEKGDVSDYLNSGGDVAKLRRCLNRDRRTTDG